MMNQSMATTTTTSINTNATTTKIAKCTQLQIPGQETNKCRITPSSSLTSFLLTANNDLNNSLNNSNQDQSQSFKQTFINELKDFFDDNLNQSKLKCYQRIINDYQWIKMKSFSTSDIANYKSFDNDNSISWCCSSPTSFNNNTNDNNNSRKYLSECNLIDYYRFVRTMMMNDDLIDCYDSGNNKNYIKDYITYSCSTLAICGDTIHSSQLPSPQTQSFRQLNSASLLFTDFDLLKSTNYKIVNDIIIQRFNEFIHCIQCNQSTLSERDITEIDEISMDLLPKPIRIYNNDDNSNNRINNQNNNYSNEDYCYSGGEILINVVNYEQDTNENNNKFTKKDKENFVLNWLQTVEQAAAGIVEPN